MTSRTPTLLLARPQSALARYGGALLVWGVALAVTLLFDEHLARSVFVAFWPAVIVAAWYGGAGPGVVVSALSVLAVDYFLIPPAGQFKPASVGDLVPLGLFVVFSTICSMLADTLRRADARAERALRDLEERAEQLEQQAVALETSQEESQSLAEELEETNAALLDREMRLAAIFQQAAAGLAQVGLDGRFVMVNDRFCEIMGHPRERLLEMRIADVTHPDDVARSVEQVRRTVVTGEPFRLEKRYVRGDGATVWATSSVSLLRTPEGAPSSLAVVTVDTTDRHRVEAALRASETRYRALVQAIAQVVWVATPEGTFAEPQPEWEAFTGQRFDDYRGNGWIDAVHPDDRAAAMEGWAQAVATRRTADVVRRVRRHDGAYRTLAMRAVPVLDAAGGVVEWIGSETDVSERVEAERERERLLEAERLARAEAEAASRAKSDFLAVMSHELRTPLNAIGGYAQLLEMGLRGPVTDAQVEDLRRIERNQRHLLSLVNDVLNFSRLQSGQVSFNVQTVPLAGAVAELEALVAPQLLAKGMRYEFVTCDEGLAVRADPERLSQILLNLLSNAIRFTEPGGRVWLACEAVADRVAIHVHDTGRGIPDDRLEDIFEPFVQVDPSYTRLHEGTGLGLAISRDLARAMGGDLSAVSRLGEGSTFTVTLPRG